MSRAGVSVKLPPFFIALVWSTRIIRIQFCLFGRLSLVDCGAVERIHVLPVHDETEPFRRRWPRKVPVNGFLPNPMLSS